MKKELRYSSVLLAVSASVVFSFGSLAFADYQSAARAYKSGDYRTAFSEYKILAEAGDVKAQVNLGWMYYAGEGVPADKQKALEWYRRGAAQGDLTAIFNLGYAFETGDGVLVDLGEARGYYTRGAAAGDSASREGLVRVQQKLTALQPAQSPPVRKALPQQEQRVVAPPAPTVVASPPPVPKVEPRSETLPKHSAASPVVTTVPVMAKPLSAPPPKKLEGKPVIPPEKTEKKIVPTPAPVPAPAAPVVPKSTEAVVAKSEPPRVANIRRMAEAGDVKSQVAMGWICSSGKGIPADKSEAVKWYKLAAEKGNVDAQAALGWLYFSGNGVKADKKMAAFWYKKAAAQGNAKAKGMLKKL